MLSLEPPFYEISNVIIYRDHAISDQFYYAATVPQIARTSGRLMFDLMAYSIELKHSVLSGTAIPEELGAGFLTMGTECVLSDAKKGDIRRQLSGLTGIPEAQISLYPIPYHKGSVSILALDAFSSPSQPTADPSSPQPLKGRPTFVEKILGSGKPSLLGDLRCIFSLSLSQEGVAFLQGLYEDKAAPVGVVYDLSFYGLPQSVDAIISANLSRIYQHFGGGLGVQYSWLKADIQAGLERLYEQGDIKIRLKTEVPGEEGRKLIDQALSLFRDRIIQDMFHPTSPALPLDALSSAVKNVTGMTKTEAKVSLALNYKKQEELKEITYDYSESAPEERNHSPQGFLPVLLSKDEVRQRIHLIDLTHSFFELLEVLVTGPTKEEFEALSIRQIEATLTYGEAGDLVSPESQTLLFRPDSTGDKTFAVKRRGRNSLSYSVALTYEFSRTTGSESDFFHYELPPQKVSGRSLLINPAVDFGVLDVEVELGRVHSDVRQVDVDLEYESHDKSFSASEHMRFVVGQEAQRQHWQVRTHQKDISPYKATYTLVFEDGTYKTPPKNFTDRLLRVDTPFVGERELLIKPVPASPQVNQILVELEYNDKKNSYWRSKMVTLNPPFESVKVKWPLLDMDQRTVSYRVTVQEPGMISESGSQTTLDPSILVGSEAHRILKVQVNLIGPSLKDANLDALQIKATASMPGTSSEEPASLLLTGDNTTGTLELILSPGAPQRYRYRTIAFKTDGSVIESEWKEATSSSLIIQTRNL